MNRKFVEIVKIAKLDSVGIEVGALSIDTVYSDQYIFTVVWWKRDEFSLIINRLWKRAMENMGKRYQSQPFDMFSSKLPEFPVWLFEL